MQLFASVPKQFAELFWQRLFLQNLRRAFATSIIVILVNLASMAIHMTSYPASEWRYFYLGALVLQIGFMVIAVFMCYKTNANPFVFGKFLYRIMDMTYVLSYLVGELLIFFFSAHDIGAWLRIITITFLAGNVIILRQHKSAPTLFVVYLLIFISMPFIDHSVLYRSSLFLFNVGLAGACSLLTSACVYSLFVNQFLADMDTKLANRELGVFNDMLEAEVHQRSTLLDTINDISRVLLNHDTENYEAILYDCMKKTAATVDVEHICLWKTRFENGQPHCTRIYEWSAEVEGFVKNVIPDACTLPEDWYDRLSRFECVGGIIEELPPDVQIQLRRQLGADDVVSTIIVPICINDRFWGLAGYADCKNMRHFPEEEEAILRTVSLLYATSMIHNEITLQLVKASEAAEENAKAKSSFLANMSHEIRTPINAITGMSSIARKTEDKEGIYQCLQRIDAASRQLLAIINDVLDMSKIEAGKIELAEDAFELVTSLQNIQGLIGVQVSQKGLTLTTDFDEHLPEIVIGDEVRISQILINLLSNAIKFTPPGGEIRFSARHIGTNENGNEELGFIVKDTGIGIAPENQVHLFDAFEQADRSVSKKFGGTGLGLAISKSIAEMMHGSITLESALGKGSCFTVRVVMRRGTRDKLRPIYTELQTENNFAGYHALLVEDIEINREIVITMLADTGLLIDVAENGQLALDMITAQPDRYDIVLMDVQMPVMDGYAATQAIRAADFPRAKGLPIIAMSANAFSEDIKKCLDVGMHDHVAKPVDFDELIYKMSQYLPEKPSAE